VGKLAAMLDLSCKIALMPDDAVEHFVKLLSAELDAERKRSADEVTQAEYRFAQNGAFSSGARVVQTAELLSAGVVRYRQCIFEKWTSYVRPRMPSLTEADRAAFVGAALNAMDAAIEAAQNHHNSRPGFNGLTGPLEQIAHVGARERTLLEAEVNLYMTTPTAPSSQTVHVATHGANSPVIVGDAGSINQEVHSAEGMANLVAAIGGLLEAMAQAPRPELDEVREILLEAREEAAKPSPNRLKLATTLAGSKDIVQTVATLQPAWEAVVRIAQMLGLA
jgi:hypothetical protein